MAKIKDDRCADNGSVASETAPVISCRQESLEPLVTAGASAHHGERRYYPNLDIVKYLAALCVVVIHLTAVQMFERPLWLETVIRTAVPFFFVSAGFLMDSHATSGGGFHAYFCKKTMTFLRLWLIWLAIYIPLDVVMELQQECSINSFFMWIFTVVSSGQGFWSWPMWYLFSSIIGCALIGLLCRRHVVRGLIWLCLSAAVLYVLAKNLSSILPPDCGLNETKILFIGDRAERFFSGAIFIPAGILLNRVWREESESWLQSLIAVILIAVGILMACYGITLDILPRSIGLVLLAISLPQVRFSTMAIRQQSMWIYYIHMYCIGTLLLLGMNPHSDRIFIFGLTLSMLAGYILYALSRHPRFSFLRALVR